MALVRSDTSNVDSSMVRYGASQPARTLGVPAAHAASDSADNGQSRPGDMYRVVEFGASTVGMG